MITTFTLLSLISTSPGWYVHFKGKTSTNFSQVRVHRCIQFTFRYFRTLPYILNMMILSENLIHCFIPQINRALSFPWIAEIAFEIYLEVVLKIIVKLVVVWVHITNFFTIPWTILLIFFIIIVLSYRLCPRPRRSSSCCSRGACV